MNARFSHALLTACAAVALVALPTAAPAQRQPASVETAVRSAAREDRDLARFYAARGNRPLWIENGMLVPAAGELIDLLMSAEADGLDPEDYRPRQLARTLDAAAERGAPAALARAELALSRTLADYVRDTRRSRDVGMVYTEAHLRPVVPTREAVLVMAAAAPDLARYVGGLGWMNPLYVRLRSVLASTPGEVDGRALPPVPAGPIMRPGTDDPRVAALRERLGLDPFGDYDEDVAAAVRELQRANGLPVDGLAGPLTVALLNRDTRSHRQLVRLNLERARALPSQLGRRYVLVDAAAARLWMMEDGEVAGTMRVVVGKPAEPTPQMAAMIRYVTLNPYWNVPPDLVRSRILPGIRKDGIGYLKAKRYEILSDWTENASRVDPATVDWDAVASGKQELRVRELPGAGNSMGRMKFMFPNDLGVYLHDTPERALMRGEERMFSAGCVRLEDAPRLARWLFGTPPKPRGNAPEQRVDLAEPVPVYLTYMTAAPEPSGVAIRPDVYGRDRQQLASLRLDKR